MLTDLQQRKLTRMFNAFDADHSGYLELGDFEAQIANIARLRGLDAGSPEHGELQSVYHAAWDNISRLADSSGDGRVTLDEWLAYGSALVQSPERFDQDVGVIAKLNARLIDRDGDGVISFEEFSAMRGSLDVDNAASFQRFDLDGDGSISSDELLELFRQFFLSDDPDAPGNFWYGPF